MARTVGVRELKARLSAWLRAVQGGATVVVTDHGRPVAEIRPVAAEAVEEGDALLEMEVRGEVTLGKRALGPLEPAKVRGGPVCGTLLDGREERA